MSSANPKKPNSNKNISSSNTSLNQQSNANTSKWNQCMTCGLIICKQFNDDHLCFTQNNEHYLNQLMEKNQAFLYSNVSYLKCIEHSKGR